MQGYKTVKLFCSNGFLLDFDKQREFIENDGHKILLEFVYSLNEYAKQVNAICYTINVLESWKNEKFFDINKTLYEVDYWKFNKEGKKLKVTLPQAKKLYKDVKIKYDTLCELLLEAGRIQYDNSNELINRYFNDER